MTTKFTIFAHAGWPVKLEFFDPSTGVLQETKFVRPNAEHVDYVHSGRDVRVIEVQPEHPRPDEEDPAWVGVSPEVEFSEAQLATDQILSYFSYGHLPQRLQEVSRPFAQLAYRLVVTAPRNAERTVALRKLLECKDAAVRASV